MVKLPHDHGQHTQQLLKNQPQQETFDKASSTFQLISDPTRLKILWLLCHSEECVINISALMEMSSPAVSHHLKQLKGSGLLISRREGKEVYYKAADTEESHLLHRTIEKIMAMTCPQ